MINSKYRSLKKRLEAESELTEELEQTLLERE